MRNSRIFLFFSIAVLLIAIGMGVARARATNDKEFVQKAASGGKMEITLGEMAIRQATSDDVKKFGQRMVDDHSLASHDLMALAEKDHLGLPRDMDKEDNSMVKHLSGLKGREFDLAYMQHMVQDHKDDVKMFQEMANDGKNPDLKNFAQRYVPILEQHLKMAQDIENKLENQKG
jgi:putative membrane protein